MGSLEEAEATRLRHIEFPYPGVGATATEPPPGYHHLRREAVVGWGETRFRACGSAVMGWQIQLRSGFTVMASEHVILENTTALLGIGIGRLRLKAPVRVAYVVDEARRRGFAYGTLPGHPELGEELFCVEHRPDDSVVLVISAFSKPQSLAATVGGPLGRVGQRLITERYLRALGSS